LEYRPYIRNPETLFKYLSHYHKQVYLKTLSSDSSISSLDESIFSVIRNNYTGVDEFKHYAYQDKRLSFTKTICNPEDLLNSLNQWTLFQEHGPLNTGSHYSRLFTRIINPAGKISLGESKIRGTYFSGSLFPLFVKNILPRLAELPKLGPSIAFGFTDHSLGELIATSNISTNNAFLSLLKLLQVNTLYALNLDMDNRQICTIKDRGITIHPVPLGYDPNTVEIFQKFLLANAHKIFVYRHASCFVRMKSDMNHRMETLNFLRVVQHNDKLSTINIVDRVLPYQAYLGMLMSSSHSLCIPGQGLDTYRFWESLALGVIPIVPRASFMSRWSSNVITYDTFDELGVILANLKPFVPDHLQLAFGQAYIDS